MSTTVWKDIDISFQPNIYNDFGIVTDANDIKATLMNNLSITSSEIPFKNKLFPILENILHAPLDYITKLNMTNIINEAIIKDERIEKMNNIVITEDTNSYTIFVSLELLVNFNSRSDVVTVNLQLKRY